MVYYFIIANNGEYETDIKKRGCRRRYDSRRGARLGRCYNIHVRLRCRRHTDVKLSRRAGSK